MISGIWEDIREILSFVLVISFILLLMPLFILTIEFRACFMNKRGIRYRDLVKMSKETTRGYWT